MNDYIEIEGKKYRVEFNWNTIANFLDAEKIPLDKLDDMSKMTANQVSSLIYSAMKEGCRKDKIDFPYVKEDFCAMLQPDDVGALIFIYQKQTTSKQLKIKKK